MPPTPPKPQTYWLGLCAVAAWGLGSVGALAMDGRMPCGWLPRELLDRFAESWVKAPGDSCDPVLPFLPDHGEPIGQQGSSPPTRS